MAGRLQNIYNSNRVVGRTEHVQCYVFLHVAGSAACKVQRNTHLPASEVDKIEPLITAFTTYCERKVNIIITHYKFHTYSQGLKGIDDYITNLTN